MEEDIAENAIKQIVVFIFSLMFFLIASFFFALNASCSWGILMISKRWFPGPSAITIEHFESKML